MRKYWAVFKINWQKSIEYRADVIGHLGMGLITFIVMYYIWSAVLKGGRTFNGYTLSSMMTYVILTRFVHFTMRSNTARQMGEEIKEGKLSIYLVKPVNYLKLWFSIFWADRLFEIIVRLGMLLTISVFFSKVVEFYGIGRFFLFLLFLFVSLIINFLINIFLACLTFWATDIQFVRTSIVMVFQFLAGSTIPLDVLPKSIKTVSLWLPFQFTAFFPIKVYQGSLTLSATIRGVILALAWIIVMFCAVIYIWGKGIKKYEATGQ
ncbi:hypothetical protein COT64_03400 [Candidatus Shapirobacteria bacterium CG09_land_8_20_14_0_10_39_12]|uniref:ABC transporter permease n=1 Tax=Candidatus Shapirobacteria bacterium CG09_land_8_20_14_0_10_39_12 TaxID=1974885 RepID=A0A2H0WNS7_9BACT|nr:MAG: hypothetical protein COT64_03400 [Candidatus Shapirobacteria bacterium CG09_land_8_20_14_0_10_39_12]